MKTRLLAVALVAGLAALTPPEARAFCGFYVSGADGELFNNATQVALMREGTRTVLSMANNYQGPPSDFAMVVPVPVVLQKENVKTLPRDIFQKLDKLTSPRLVEYWEQDPCYQPPRMEMAPMAAGAPPPPAPPPAPMASLGVKIEAQFTVGEYEVVILSADNSLGLDTWLRQNRYNIPKGAEPVLKPYVQAGMKFFVAKVDIAKVKKEGDKTMLSPLRFHYDTDRFELPVRLGLLNSSGVQDLVVHILARGKRYEVANYPNVTIPTNLDVREAARGQFGAFYAALFDQTVAKNPRAAVTEYAWDAGSCDPCPTPPLAPSDLATLGADALTSAKPIATSPGFAAPPPPSPPPPPGGAGQTRAAPPPAPPPPPPMPMPMPMPMPPFFGGGGFVVTRMHLRYGRSTLGEDLVFKEAPSIAGGREHLIDQQGTLEKGSHPEPTNNFQARYAIRHAWTGPIKCEHPHRGVWGGPPPGVKQVAEGPQSATDIAFAPRGTLSLSSVVAQPVPELGVTPGGKDPAPPAGGDGAATPPSTHAGGGCAGCAVGASPQGWVGVAGALSLLGALGVRWRRRGVTRGRPRG